MTVNVSLSGEYFPDQFNWNHVWYEDNFAGIIRELITTQFTDPIVAFLPIYTFLNPLVPRDTYYFPTPQLNIQLNCVSRGESTQVREKELKDIWEHVLQWVSSEAHRRCMHVE